MVDCGNRPICDKNNENCRDQDATTTTEPDTTTEHEQVTSTDDNWEFKCPEPWGYYADPKNCIKYYVCSDRVPERMTCQKSR